MVRKPENFTDSAQEALQYSQELVRRFRHAQWDVEHVFLALVQLLIYGGAIVIVADITDRKQAQEELLQQMQELNNQLVTKSLLYHLADGERRVRRG